VIASPFGRGGTRWRDVEGHRNRKHSNPHTNFEGTPTSCPPQTEGDGGKAVRGSSRPQATIGIAKIQIPTLTPRVHQPLVHLRQRKLSSKSPQFRILNSQSKIERSAAFQFNYIAFYYISACGTNQCYVWIFKCII